jgi:hypothetical protein
MKEDQLPRSVSSSTWTGPPPETSYNGVNRTFRPRWDSLERRTRTVALLLLAGCVLAFVAWYIVLGFHSTVAPSPATGQTEAMNLSGRRGPPIYVRPLEALITYALLAAAFVVPVAYLLGSEALRRRSKK